MKKLLIFAGTTEGRRVLELLSGCDCTLWVSTATEYGGESLAAAKGVVVLTGRMDKSQMCALLVREHFDCVIDATHPFAREVTENIRAACHAENTRYLRILRTHDALMAENDICVRVESVAEAASYLAEHTQGNILLTTGSKELATFASMPGFVQRVFARVLPLPDSLRQCAEAGLPVNRVIAMQGPFSADMNAAMLCQINAKWLVTKETGDAGGFAAKCEGAVRAGAKLLVIARPGEDGLTLDRFPAWAKEQLGIQVRECENCSQYKDALPENAAEICATHASYFPMFIPLAGRAAVVLGGGAIAARRALVLAGFGCLVRVISPELCETLEQAALRGEIEPVRRRYSQGDCAGASLVVAATNERAANAAAAQECKTLGVPVSVADLKEESTFYFPGIIKQNGVTIGVTANGQNHRLARAVTRRIRENAESLIKACGEEST